MKDYILKDYAQDGLIACLMCDGLEYNCCMYNQRRPTDDTCIWFSAIESDLEKLFRNSKVTVSFYQLSEIIRAKQVFER